MNNILEVNNLSYKKIFDNLSFNLKENTFNVLLGKNSSGKTLLCKIIYGLINCNAEIKIKNNILTKNSVYDIRKNIGILTEENELNEKTVLDNIILPMKNLGYNKKYSKESAIKIAHDLEINNLIYKKIDEISKVERKKVLLCSILVHKPKLIIIDSSLSEFDNVYRKKIINYLKKLTKESTTILFITNNSEDILFSDSTLILKDGKIKVYDDLNSFFQEDKILSKINFKPPFMIDLSSKLKTYGLINDLILKIDKMVDEIWK